MKLKPANSIIFSAGVGAILALMLSCNSLQENWPATTLVACLLLVVSLFSTQFVEKKEWLFWLIQVLTFSINLGAFWYIIAPNYQPLPKGFRGGGHYFYSLLAIYIPFLYLSSNKFYSWIEEGYEMFVDMFEGAEAGPLFIKISKKVPIPFVYLLIVTILPWWLLQWPEKWSLPSQEATGAEVYSIYYSYPEFICLIAGILILYYIAGKVLSKKF